MITIEQLSMIILAISTIILGIKKEYVLAAMMAILMFIIAVISQTS